MSDHDTQSAPPAALPPIPEGPDAIVRQVDAYGCGVACLAMVTGRSYNEVRSWFRVPAFANARHDGRDAALVGPARETAEPKDFTRAGIDHFDVQAYLAEHGAASALRFSTPRYGDTRDAWPLPPFAPAHICQVLTVAGPHAVVWLSDGTVLDPARETPTTLDDPCYCGLQWVIGVYGGAALLASPSVVADALDEDEGQPDPSAYAAVYASLDAALAPSVVADAGAGDRPDMTNLLYDHRTLPPHEARKVRLRIEAYVARLTSERDAATRRAEALTQALVDITEPIDALRRYAESQGGTLNGPMAVQLASSASHLQSIARAALAATRAPSAPHGGETP